MKRIGILTAALALSIALVGGSVWADDGEQPSTHGWNIGTQYDANTGTVTLLLSIDNPTQVANYDGLVTKSWGSATDESKWIDLGGGSKLCTLDLGLDGDPRVMLNFSVVAGTADTTFSIVSNLLGFTTLNPAEGTATAAVTVTDNDGNGATGTGLYTGDKFYSSIYNGSTVFGNLVGSPVTAAGWASSTGSGNVPAWQGMGSVSSMQAGFNFRLSANDGASGTSNFVVRSVVPEPGSIAALLAGVLGIGGAMIRRKKA
jgi:hypothetical protein